MRGRRRSILALGLLVSCVYPTFTTTASETVNYTYDSRGRLIAVGRSGTINNGVNACYTYDKADNRSNVATGSAACPNPPPSFSVSNATADEGSPLTFTVTRGGSASGIFSVDYATSNSTATAGSDYDTATGTLTFADGEVTKPINVTTINDAAPEGNEVLNVTLSNASGGAAITDGAGTGTINANDGLVNFAISDAATTEGTGLVFTVVKIGNAQNATFSVNFYTANGTATAGSDYQSPFNQTLTFSPFETEKTITVPTFNGPAAENAETVLVNLLNATGGATIKDGQGVGTIYDNQTLPGPRFVISDAVVGQGGQTKFTVTRVGPQTSASIQYATANGTALAGTHYTATNYTQVGQGSLVFQPTTTSLSVYVPTLNNGLPVDGKYFYLNISSSSGAIFIDSQAVGTIYK